MKKLLFTLLAAGLILATGCITDQESLTAQLGGPPPLPTESVEITPEKEESMRQAAIEKIAAEQAAAEKAAAEKLAAEQAAAEKLAAEKAAAEKAAAEKAAAEKLAAEKEAAAWNEVVEMLNLSSGIYAVISTPHGNIICQLEYEKTPLTVVNFIGLAEGKIKNRHKAPGVPYYNGLKFHRVIDNFMVQGGCPLGMGSGDPGYKFPDEIDPSLKHTGPGTLSMANSGPGTNGSQFFITHVATPWLDGKHTVFGYVVKGQDIVNTIRKDDKIEKITIKRLGEKAEQFKADQDAFTALLTHIAEAEKERTEKAAATEKERAAKAATAHKNLLSSKFPGAQKTASGLMYVLTKTGSGAQPQSGAVVSVHYTGKLMDGTTFDSSIPRGAPIQFPVGTGRVIPGWDEGIMMMREGGKRTLIIPPELAYGARGSGPIPPNSWLVFDVELISAGN